MADADADVSKSKSKSDSKHVCVFCHASFTDKKQLQEHFRQHGSTSKKKQKTAKPKQAEAPIKCDFCTTEFPTVSLAIYHLYRWHRDSALTHFCPWCGKQFPIKHTYNIHLKEHENETVPETLFQCTECIAKFYSEKTLRNHLKLSHQMQNEAVVLPPPSKKININSFGDVQSVYFCYMCGQEYIMKFNLKKHLVDRHSDQLYETPGNVIKCTTCEALFYNEKAYQFHNRFHNPKDVYVTSEEMRLNVITKIDQDFDLRRVRNLHPVKNSNTLAKNISQKQAELAASIGNTSNFSPPPSDDSGSETEIEIKKENPDNPLLNDPVDLPSENDESNLEIKDEPPDINIEDEIVFKEELPNISLLNEPFDLPSETLKIDVSKSKCYINRTSEKRKQGVSDTNEINNSNKRSKLSTCTSSTSPTLEENIQNDIEKSTTSNSGIGLEILNRNESQEIMFEKKNSSHTSNKSLTESKENHKNYYQIQCNYCDAKLDSIHNAIFHRFHRHKNIVSTDRQYCPWCGEEFLIKYLFNIHVKTHQDMVFEVACDCKECDIVFFNEAALECHQNINHSENTSIDVFIPRPSMKIQLDLNNIFMVYYCHVCGQEFSTNKQIMEHVLQSHKDSKQKVNCVQCAICESEFNHASAFNYHKRFHKPKDVYINIRRNVDKLQPDNESLPKTSDESICRLVNQSPNPITSVSQTNSSETNSKMESKKENDIQKANTPKNNKLNVKMISKEELEKLKSKGAVRPITMPKNIEDLQTKKSPPVVPPKFSTNKKMELGPKLKGDPLSTCHVKLKRMDEEAAKNDCVKRTRSSAKTKAVAHSRSTSKKN